MAYNHIIIQLYLYAMDSMITFNIRKTKCHSYILLFIAAKYFIGIRVRFLWTY